MAEEGIDVSAATPKILTADAVGASDAVITMGCDDACAIFRAGAIPTGRSMTGRAEHRGGPADP